MKKIEILTALAKRLEREVTSLDNYAQQPGAPDSVAAEVAQLRAVWAEVLAHEEYLICAEFTCQLAQEGTVPDYWEEARDGVYDPYEAVLAYLSALPGGGQLSPTLLAYVDELPGQQQASHDEVMDWLRDSAQQSDSAGQTLLHSMLLDDWNKQTGRPTRLAADEIARQLADMPANPSPLRELAPAQVERISLGVQTKYLEQMAPLLSYATDVVQARELANQRGHWTAILDCLK